MPDTDDLFTNLYVESDEDKTKIDEIITILNKFIEIYDLTEKEDPQLSKKAEKILLESNFLVSDIPTPNTIVDIHEQNKKINTENLKKLNDFLSQIESFMSYPRFNDYIRENKEKLLSILGMIQTDFYIPKYWLGYDKGLEAPPNRIISRLKKLDKTWCKYGTLCYQKNEQHRESFKHTIKRKNDSYGPMSKKKPKNKFAPYTRGIENGGNKNNKTKKKRKKYTKKKRKYNKK